MIATLLCALAAAAQPAVIRPQEFNSAGIAAALRRAAAGDTVQLPAGTFTLTEAVRPKSGVRLIGAGQDKTRLVYRGTGKSMLINIAACQDVEIAHLTLDGENQPLVEQGITGSDARWLWLHHLTIRNLKAKTWGPHAILFSGVNPTMERGVTDSRITDCLIESVGLDAEYGGGIRLAWGSARNQVLRNVIRDTGRGGIFGDHATDLVIRHNRVSGSRGEGLGIEIWGGCRRSLIEDNVIDHWLSVDQGTQSAIRRNVIAAEDGTLKFLGIEIIARDCVVTDNVVKQGASIGLSVSNQPVKNNVFWGYNAVRGCAQWGAQLQGERGGIAHHYFYHCVFEDTVRGHPQAIYPGDSGHGFRTNGSCRGLVFEDCVFRRNGGYGLQLGGSNVDFLDVRRATITGNGLAAVTGPWQYTALAFHDCTVKGNQDDRLPPTKEFSAPPPVADFHVPESIHAGQPATFHCRSNAPGGIAERLWDLGDGIPEVTADARHVFAQPGKYRVTLIVWDNHGRGGHAEKTIDVLPGKQERAAR